MHTPWCSATASTMSGVTGGSRAAGDPAHHLVEQLLPAGRVDRYAVASGHRLMLGSHTTASSTVAALVRSSAPSLSSQVTIYGWSIKRHRAVATRYDKLAVRYRATVSIATINEWL